jgi:flagellar biosynthesis protein FlhG
MKRIEEMSCHELLEVRPGATAKEIQKAYERARGTFQADSVAVYSLYSAEEVERIRKAVEEAYRALVAEAGEEPEPAQAESFPSAADEVGPEEEEPGIGVAEPSLTPAEEAMDSPPEVVIPQELLQGPFRGRTLREIRERLGVDLKTVAAETRVTAAILGWIEEEALERLPAPVYLRGFLKIYGRTLGLDPGRVADDFMSLFTVKKKR